MDLCSRATVVPTICKENHVQSDGQTSWHIKARANFRRFLEELEAARGRPEFNAAAMEQLIAEVKRRLTILNDPTPK